MQVPCKDCTQRKLGCHSKCENYAEFVRHRQESRERAAQQHELDYYDRKRIEELRRRRHI